VGRAIIALVEHELASTVDEAGEQPVFLTELKNCLGEREASLDARERGLEVRDRCLRESEQWIQAAQAPLRLLADVANVGRNDRCP